MLPSLPLVDLFTPGLAEARALTAEDEPERIAAAIRLALAYRQEFGRDVVVDLVGYRRFGHNEQDEAAYTQPLMVAQIAAQPTAREKYAATLVDDQGKESLNFQISMTIYGIVAAILVLFTGIPSGGYGFGRR